LTGNFQVDNFGKGGEQEDGIIVNNQSDRSADDSEFATPPDGLSGVATFYLFKLTSPHRDAGLDSFIGLHEFTHGLTQRLTGGSRNGQCLQELEPQGLAEGWSDAVAMFLLRSEQDTRNDDFAAGWYSTGSSSPSEGGLRMYPYSTNIETNILRYRNLATLFKPHQIGSVWATVLNEVYWNLVDLLGFGTNWYDSQQRKGNIVMLKILVGGLMLQPCNPTVLQARDAILGAEAQYYDSEYKCTIWKGFAKRGMGTGAVHKDGRFFDDNKIPEECGI
jgi:extracellular elastinolytic metalloproteinase